ncbi:MAG: hypothetical protein HFJ36_05915 [Clostridia bacterium]|nr:hypothetical protein [Clostridia bacterium]
MAFIIIVSIVIYFVLIAWTWQSLGFIEKTKKVGIIVIGIFLTYIITLIVFQIAKGDITYPNANIQNSIKNMLVAIFTGINGLIVMPQIGKMLDKINEDEIEKEQLTKRVIILLIIFIICLVFESGYMKNTQEGILKIYQTMVEK